jgi:hypothetical protein
MGAMLRGGFGCLDMAMKCNRHLRATANRDSQDRKSAASQMRSDPVGILALRASGHD